MEGFMRRFVLMVLAGLAIVAAVPQSGSASPLMPAAGLAAAVDDIAVTQDVRYWRHHHWRHYGWHRHYGWRHHRHWRHYGWRRHHWRHYGWRHHHRRHWARYY
jgi:hypothetical protein